MQWTDLAAITSTVGVCIFCATTYLRLFVRNQLAEHEANMHEWLGENYHGKALIDLRFESLDSRVSRLEAMQDA